MKTVCVIPAWNEEKNIAAVIAPLSAYVDEIIVVDDGSSDQTAAQANEAGAFVLQHVVNRGQGAALATGNAYALKRGADIIIHFDADNQFSAGDIPKVIAPLLESSADIVFGSRFLGIESNLPAFKGKVIMPLARFVNRFFFGIKLSDPQNGFRAFTRETAEKIQIENRGFAHNNEIQIKSFALKLRVQEVPVSVTYHRFGQKLGGGFKILKDLLISKILK